MICISYAQPRRDQPRFGLMVVDLSDNSMMEKMSNTKGGDKMEHVILTDADEAVISEIIEKRMYVYENYLWLIKIHVLISGEKRLLNYSEVPNQGIKHSFNEFLDG